MKQLNTVYYLLFVLLIMGAFAAMAQNDYGITILGIVAGSFGLIFLFQSISIITKGDWTLIIELTSLTVLAVIMALRVFYIHFAFVELAFGLAGVFLIFAYMKRMMNAYSSVHTSSKRLAWLVCAFYSSILLYTLSMVTVAFIPAASEPAGGIAFGLLLLFTGGSFIFREFLFAGEKISAFQFISRSKDTSIVLMSLFLLFTLYMGFTKINLLPKMYSNEFPQSYFELVKRAETGKEKAIHGKYRHEEFKEKYDRFVERTSAIGKK